MARNERWGVRREQGTICGSSQVLAGQWQTGQQAVYNGIGAKAGRVTAAGVTAAARA